MRLQVLVWLFLLLGCSGWSVYANPESRLGLVIGNSTYPTAPLVNLVHDAQLMTSTLKALGFTVVEVFDADQKTLKRVLQEFGERLERSGRDPVGLFYYAGHGIQVGGTNYLIPVDANIARESDAEIEAVSTQAVLATLDYARNRLNLIILPRGDSDWYRVTMDEQGALDVAITNVLASLAVQFRVWNAGR